MFIIPQQQEQSVLCTDKEEMDDFEGTNHDMQAQAAFWPSHACPNPHANYVILKI